MRVLVSTNAFFGHFTPLVPLASTLQARGHSVVVATEPAFAPNVRAHGLDHVGIGRDLTLDDTLAALPDIFSVAPEDQDAYARPRMFVELRAHNVVDDLHAFVAQWKPDVVVRESAEFGSWAVAERRGIPHIAVSVGAGNSSAEWDTCCAAWFRDLGRQVGIDDLHARSLYRYGVLAFEPAGYTDWADTPTASVYRPARTTTGRTVDRSIAELDERPLIYATLGTEFYNPDLMSSIIAAVRNDAWNVVVTTGPQGDPTAIDPGISNVVVTKWVPQDDVMDRAAVVISHAGAGTITGALVRGIPTVCVPQGADQFHHARRVAELGVGVELPVDRRTPADIRAAVDRVFDDPAYREAGRKLAAATALLPDVEVAARRVEATG